MSSSPEDRWESASAYERFMGRWSRELARVFVSWLDAPPAGHWLEVGCGTGALTSGILELGRAASVVATDASPQFVEHARAAFPAERVQFLAASADDLPRRTAGYDVIASSLVLNFIPDPTAALRAMRSLAAEHGTVAACVWDYADGMEFLRRFWDAAVELDPAAREYDEGVRFPICSPSGLTAAFQGAEFAHVDVEGLQVQTRFESFDDYWTPFVGGPGPAPGYLASLPAERQQELQGRLAETLPRHEDGSITLTARAWAARAMKPGATTFVRRGGRMVRMLFLALAAAATACARPPAPAEPVGHQPAEEAEVLAVMDAYMLEISANDLAAMDARQTAEGMTYRHVARPEGGWDVVARSNKYWVAPERADDHTYRERYWSPTVMIRGSMALVWAPYEFQIDGATSHCGIDVFSFAKIGGVWKVSNSMWTVEADTCEELHRADEDSDAPPDAVWTLKDGKISRFQQYVDTAHLQEVMGAQVG